MRGKGVDKTVPEDAAGDALVDSLSPGSFEGCNHSAGVIQLRCTQG